MARPHNVYNQYTNPWTEEEVTIIKQNYNKMSDELLADQLHRTPLAIQCKRREIGLKKRRMSKWTAEELEMLQKLLRVHQPVTKIMDRFPNRTLDGLYKKVRFLSSNRKFFSHLKIEQVKALSDFEKGWISALIDGEGSISLCIVRKPRKLRYKGDFALEPNITIVNNNLELLEKVKNVIGGGIVRQKYKNPTLKPTYHWYLTGIYRILSLLKQVAPHLIVKRKQAELMLNFCSYRIRKLNNSFYAGYTQEEIEMAHQMGVLNSGKRHN
jgi:hypothetical protein